MSSEYIREALTWCFQRVDSDSSGFIEQTEGLLLARYSGIPQSGLDGYWKKMLEDMDTDGDGKISLDEFVTWMAKNKTISKELADSYKQELDQKLNQHAFMKEQAARAMDLDDLEEVALDGSVAAKPAAPAMTAAKAKELRAKFKELDVDNDGTVTKAELEGFLVLMDEEMLEQLFKKADEDGSGSISFEEFCNVVGQIDEAKAAEDEDMDALLPD